MVRRLLERAQQLRREAEHWQQPTNQLVEQLQHDVEAWQQRRTQLAESFIHGSLAGGIPSLHEVKWVALAEMKALQRRTRQAWQDNEVNRLLGPQWQLRSWRLRPFDPCLDVTVLQSAFAWLDLHAARSPEERNQCVGILRELLTICLQRRPR